jgi:hypothetical protein
MVKIKIFFLCTLFILPFSYKSSEHSPKNSSAKAGYSLDPADKKFLDTLQYKTFLYFWYECNPDNGLVKDRSTEDSPASIAAVGFAFPAWAIGVEHNWILRKEAVQRTLAALNFFMTSEQSEDSLATGYQGLYYHFLDMKTGKRKWACELSTIDTGLLLAGIRFARQYYNLNNPNEKKIRCLADSITYRANWDFMTIPESGKYGGLISMAWRPEKKLSDYGWFGYNEGLILQIIAAGSGYPNYQKSYDGWLKTYKWDKPYPGLAHVVFPPLFGHQYSHMFVDFRGIFDKYMKAKGIDYFENSQRATLTQRLYAIQNPNGWKGYDSLIWGLTACDGPGSKFNKDNMKFNDYSARGTSGPDLVWSDDGTIAPTAAGGSIAFAPEIVIPALEAMKKEYGDEGLWNKYGFVDAFNPTINWYDSDYLGIDEGPIIIMIENFRNGFVWKYMMKDTVIKNGLKKLGFK